MKPFVLAIDGPADAGKSVTARGVASRLGLLHVDSGAMYRAAAWLAARAGVDLADEGAVLEAVGAARFDVGPEGLLLDGRSVEAEIRTAEAGEAASRVAVHAALRKRLVRIQRGLARSPGVVMEGRDIGTVVFPKADLKIYLSASVEARARRRREELLARGEPADPAAIEAMVRERDERDARREASPLRPAPDAIPLDTTDLTLEEQVDLAAHWAELALHGGSPMTAFYWFGSRFVRYFSRTALRFRMEGFEQVPRTGPLIVASNHISFWDPPLIGSNFPRVLHFLAKAELFQNKVFGAMLRGYNSIPIQRGPQARSGLRGAEEALNRGGAVLIFPEGTRNKSGALLPPRAGIGRLAAVTRAPVLPVRITGSNRIRRSMMRRMVVRIACGPLLMPPVHADGSREAEHAYACRVMDAIAALHPSGGKDPGWK